MTSTTRIYGIVLIVIGVAAYFWTGRTSVTALIPSFFGALLLICALIARNEAARKHAMHVAVTLALFGSLSSFYLAAPGLTSGNLLRPAVVIQLVMAIVLIIYVVHGVESFISARRARLGR